MNDAIVCITSLTKFFDKTCALDNISASIPHGQMVGLAGPDGAGKTTLIRLIAGLLKPSSGTISTLGFDTIKEAEYVHESIGYMPQKFGLYEDLTVFQNLNLYADLRGVKAEDKPSIFEKLLEFTSLKPFTERLAKNLSGGMKQKLGLACALVSKPKFLILDEPSVGVDPRSRKELWKIVQSLVNEGISVLWSTAYLDEAEKCDTVLLMSGGKLLYQGPPQNLTNRMEERTYLINSPNTSRRDLLNIALNDPNIEDATIQGNAIRAVVKEKGMPNLGTTDLTVRETPPRFEDAFIDILGGAPKIESPLAAMTPPITPKEKYVIIADGLTKRFGNFTAASDISFKIPPGEIFGLLGPNGAGKSTTFKMLCGLLKPTHGTATVNGIDLQAAPSQARAQIGYMAQKFSLYDYLSSLQNLEFFAGVYNLANQEKQKRINEMIDIFNLTPYLDQSAGDLPLGFKQRLALSSALMHNPTVLFLDEPTSGVDPLTRREFWSHINGLVEKGVTIMVTTHFMDEVEYCDRIGLVYQGKLIKVGTPDLLKQDAITKQNPNPTLEDAFIQLIDKYDEDNHA